MNDIVEFITARLNEREAVALAAQAVDPSPWRADADDESGTAERSAGFGLLVAADGVALWDCEGSRLLCMTAPTTRHVALNDPAHVLADVAARRQILAAHAHVPAVQQDDEQDNDFGCQTCHNDNHCGETMGYGWCATVRLHALPDAAHPDYIESWRP